MSFHPRFCPHPDCPSRASDLPFRWTRKGFYRRRCDGRRVQRFRCLVCERRFSSQTFRFNFRWHQPRLHLTVFDLLVSKVTLRRMARMLGVSRVTIERRLERLGGFCKSFHQKALSRMAGRGGLTGTFQLDELETFETDRLLKPVTMPVLIERSSSFVVTGEVAAMGPRGNLSPRMQRKRERMEAREGERRSGSTKAVRACLEEWRRVHSPNQPFHFQSDQKTSYQKLFREICGDRFGSHLRVHSKRTRDHDNPLFPINHTFAVMRDAMSRLVRRNWGVSKIRSRLRTHFWVWAVFRNYVCGITLKTKTTPAMGVGVVLKRLRKEELFYWRWPFRMVGWVH